MDKKEQITLSDAMTKALGITTEELVYWFKPLPLVYKKSENEFEVLPDFIPERKYEFFGFEFAPGVIVEKAFSAKNIEDIDDTLILNGKKGHLPSYKRLKKHWSEGLKKRLDVTAQLLRNNGIEASGGHGKILLSGKRYIDGKSVPTYFDLEDGKECFSGANRLLIAFS